MENTVTSPARYGTVECFANILRPAFGTYIALPGALKAIVDSNNYSAEEKLEHVRNALAAADLVDAEIRAAGR
jgi:hypothetical protein